MRRCRNCGRFNAGTPTRCRFCGRGLTGRLCPRNHINPPDPTASLCGECGEPLEPYSGWLWQRPGVVALLVSGVGLAGFAICMTDALPRIGNSMTSFFISAIVFIIIARLLVGVLPSWARELVQAICVGIGRFFVWAVFRNRL